MSKTVLKIYNLEGFLLQNKKSFKTESELRPQRVRNAYIA